MGKVILSYITLVLLSITLASADLRGVEFPITPNGVTPQGSSNISLFGNDNEICYFVNSTSLDGIKNSFAPFDTYGFLLQEVPVGDTGFKYKVSTRGFKYQLWNDGSLISSWNFDFGGDGSFDSGKNFTIAQDRNADNFDNSIVLNNTLFAPNLCYGNGKNSSGGNCSNFNSVPIDYTNIALVNKTNYFLFDQMINHTGATVFTLKSMDGSSNEYRFVRSGAGRDWRIQETAGGNLNFDQGTDDVTFGTNVISITTLGVTIQGTTTSNIFKGTGSEVVLQDGAGNQAFRALRNNISWGASGNDFFQVGLSNDNVSFTAGSGTVINNLQFTALHTQIRGSSYLNPPLPTSTFEILNVTNGAILKAFENKSVVFSGDVFIDGNTTANSFYAEMFFHNDTVSNDTVMTQNVIYNVSFSQGTNGNNLNGFTYSANKLTALVSGMYKIDYCLSFSSSATNHKYHFFIAVNGTQQVNTEAHNRLANNDIADICGTGLKRLNVNDYINLQFFDETAGSTISIYSADVNLFRVGN